MLDNFTFTFINLLKNKGWLVYISLVLLFFSVHQSSGVLIQQGRIYFHHPDNQASILIKGAYQAKDLDHFFSSHAWVKSFQNKSDGELKKDLLGGVDDANLLQLEKYSLVDIHFNKILDENEWREFRIALAQILPLENIQIKTSHLQHSQEGFSSFLNMPKNLLVILFLIITIIALFWHFSILRKDITIRQFFVRKSDRFLIQDFLFSFLASLSLFFLSGFFATRPQWILSFLCLSLILFVIGFNKIFFERQHL